MDLGAPGTRSARPPGGRRVRGSHQSRSPARQCRTALRLVDLGPCWRAARIVAGSSPLERPRGPARRGHRSDVAGPDRSSLPLSPSAPGSPEHRVAGCGRDAWAGVPPVWRDGTEPRGSHDSGKPSAPVARPDGIRGYEMDTLQLFEQTRPPPDGTARGSPQGAPGRKASGFWNDTSRDLRRARWSCPCCRVANGVPADVGPPRSPWRVLV